MSKKENNRATSDNVAIINANPADFRNGRHNRYDNLVEAVKPITDTWYPRFYKAAQEGSDALIQAWLDYDHTYFPTIEHPADEIFRYAAITMILNTLHTEAYDKKSGIRETTQAAIGLIRDRVRKQATYWWPAQRFAHEAEVFNVAKDIDTLSAEYPEVAK